jgi:LPXTG-site transpeptidase (sortase) family protein
MIRKLFKPYIFVFLIALIVWNWNSISWFFSYRVVSEKMAEALSVAPVETVAIAQEEVKTDNQTVKSENSVNNTVEGDRLEIPKIKISVPLVSVSTTEQVYKALDRGVVYYPTSVLPGTDGQTIILGHSAPENWPMIKHDWVFSDLNDLVEDDEFTIYFNDKKLEYVVVKKIFLDKGEDIPTDLANSDNMVVLVSCWPPGKDLKRIAVVAILR